ncbi:MAG: hypothetical protein IJU70_08420 [Lentisphaeria bacterium]|nr:hypothetical protein [Lentisphaeria bacterium]
MLREFLFQNWMPADGAEEMEQSCPEKLFFFSEEFIRKYYPVAGLPPERLESVLAKAAAFDGDRIIRLLAWRMYNKFCKVTVREFCPFPEFVHPLGYDTGMLYLLLLLSLIPELEARAEKERFPLRYAHAAATRIGTFPVYFAQAFGGRFGIRSRSMHFMLHFKDSPMFRIGRFDFILEKAGERFPRVYARGKEVTLLCDAGWLLDRDGERLYPYAEPEKIARVTRFRNDGSVIRGTAADIRTGLALPGEVELDARQWQCIASPGDWVLHFHIPAGGGMSPGGCRASFDEALSFFAAQYPDKPVRLIYSVSWIFNHAWLDYIPDSNMSALIRSSALYPCPHAENAGLFFVFGREDADYASYPRTNSLERAVLDCIADGRPLRTPGIIILPLPGRKQVLNRGKGI